MSCVFCCQPKLPTEKNLEKANYYKKQAKCHNEESGITPPPQIQTYFGIPVNLS